MRLVHVGKDSPHNRIFLEGLRESMPASSALYFTVEDSRRETALMPHAELRVIESIWGHRAGNPWQCPHDEAVIRVVVQKLLSNDGA